MNRLPSFGFIVALYIILLSIGPSFSSPELSVALGQLKTSFIELNKQNLREIGHSPSTEHSITISRRYGKKVETLLAKSADPAVLADLAIWAEHEDPFLSSSSYVFRCLFDKCILRLGSINTDPARLALKQVKETLSRTHHLDGHLAEVIEEAEGEKAK